MSKLSRRYDFIPLNPLKVLPFWNKKLHYPQVLSQIFPDLFPGLFSRSFLLDVFECLADCAMTLQTQSKLSNSCLLVVMAYKYLLTALLDEL